jgi:hypothetical protein
MKLISEGKALVVWNRNFGISEVPLLISNSVLWGNYGPEPFKHRNGGFESSSRYGCNLMFHNGDLVCPNFLSERNV